MTDLEDLWGSLPTGEPPVARIIARARRPARSRLRRPLIAVGTVCALGTAFAVGTRMPASPPGSEPPPTAEGPATGSAPGALSPVAFHADLSPADSCDALLDTYVSRALGRVTAWGWESELGGYGDLYRSYAAQAGRTPVPAAGELDTRTEPTTSRVTSSDTGTNVQEEHVDEPDAVKTDGQLLVRLRGSELIVYDVTAPHVQQLSALTLEGVEDGELLLAGDTVVAIGADAESPKSRRTGAPAGTRVQTISLADPAEPAVTAEVTYDAAVTSVRQHDDTIRLVLASGLPDLAFVQPGKEVARKEALRHNRRVVERSTLRDWLPGYDSGDGRRDLLECGDVAVPPAEVGLDTVSVVTFDAGAPDTPTAFGLAGSTTIAYESTDHLYLVATPAFPLVCFACFDRTVRDGTSYLFEFDLEGDRAVHVASGEVEGTIRDRWSLDEADGELRVLVGPSSETGPFNSIVTLRRQGDSLVETGRLDRLGAGEDIKSVRWQDDLALVVTFRQVDPLYVVDLRDRPRLVSELRVPGFSSYLHPLGSRRLVGVGSGPGEHGWGAQLGLFRTRDLRHVTALDVTHFRPGSRPVAAEDPRSFTWLPEHRTVLTVIQRGRTGWLSIERLTEGTLQDRLVRVEYGEDIAQVRTIGMADGRVVLVTGEDVRFLRL